MQPADDLSLPLDLGAPSRNVTTVFQCTNLHFFFFLSLPNSARTDLLLRGPLSGQRTEWDVRDAPGRILLRLGRGSAGRGNETACPGVQPRLHVPRAGWWIATGNKRKLFLPLPETHSDSNVFSLIIVIYVHVRKKWPNDKKTTVFVLDIMNGRVAPLEMCIPSLIRTHLFSPRCIFGGSTIRLESLRGAWLIDRDTVQIIRNHSHQHSHLVFVCCVFDFCKKRVLMLKKLYFDAQLSSGGSAYRFHALSSVSCSLMFKTTPPVMPFWWKASFGASLSWSMSSRMGYGRSTGGPCGLQLGLSRFGGNNLPLLTWQSEHYLSMICEDADDEINPPPPPVALW